MTPGCRDQDERLGCVGGGAAPVLGPASPRGPRVEFHSGFHKPATALRATRRDKPGILPNGVPWARWHQKAGEMNLGDRTGPRINYERLGKQTPQLMSTIEEMQTSLNLNHCHLQRWPMQEGPTGWCIIRGKQGRHHMYEYDSLRGRSIYTDHRPLHLQFRNCIKYGTIILNTTKAISRSRTK